MTLPRVTARAIAIGAFLGLFWGVSMRAWMTVLAFEFGDWPIYTARGTFVSVVAPAAAMGALLGWAEAARRDGGRRGWRWATLAPLLMVVPTALMTPAFVKDLLSTGLGSGAITVGLIGLLGGYAVSGRGPLWARLPAGTLALAPMLSLTYFLYLDVPESITASRVFGAVMLWVLVTALVAAASIPHRRCDPAPTRSA